jgi:hypothetical protein
MGGPCEAGRFNKRQHFPWPADQLLALPRGVDVTCYSSDGSFVCGCQNWVWPEQSASQGSTPLISISVHKALWPIFLSNAYCGLFTGCEGGGGGLQWGVELDVRLHVTPGLNGAVLRSSSVTTLIIRTCFCNRLHGVVVSGHELGQSV